MSFEYWHENQKKIDELIKNGATLQDFVFIESLFSKIELIDQDMSIEIRDSVYKTVNSLKKMGQIDIPLATFEPLVSNPIEFEPLELNLINKLEEKLAKVVKTIDFYELSESNQNFLESFAGYLQKLQITFYRASPASKLLLSYSRLSKKRIEELENQNFVLKEKVKQLKKSLETKKDVTKEMPRFNEDEKVSGE